MTSEVTQAALEPCPFCGGEAFTVEEHWRDGSIRGGEPICKGCGVKMPRHWSKRKADAIAAWNTRLTAQSGEDRSGAGEDALLEEVIANAIAANVRLEWHGHDHASINPRSITIAARSILAALNARQSGEGERE